MASREKLLSGFFSTMTLEAFEANRFVAIAPGDEGGRGEWRLGETTSASAGQDGTGDRNGCHRFVGRTKVPDSG